MSWNIGKEMSENYEFFLWIFMALQRHSYSEKQLIKFADNAVICGEKELRKKPLGSDFLRMLNREKEPLNVIVKGHLFIEYFLDTIVEKKFKNHKVILKNNNFTFSLRLDILRAKNYLDLKLYKDIKLLNTLRNKFAHNLYYDLGAFDVSRFSYCEDCYTYVKSKSSKSRTVANIYMLKHILFNMLIRLTSKYEFIGDVNIPECIKGVRSTL